MQHHGYTLAVNILFLYAAILSLPTGSVRSNDSVNYVPITRRIVVVPRTNKMSPPIHPPRQRKGFLRDLKSSDIPNFQIVQVEEDKQDEMYCSELVRRLIMLQPVTAAAAVFTGYRYWRLQFAQLLMLQSLGLNMKARLVFAVIDFIVNSKLVSDLSMKTIPHVKAPDS